ncbi:MAG: efflux RND transporter periplasmic adaptor subunit [Patescibacteria group bacterium]|nr:efflux RND transporter periplasmic adaptor subunit [Patescibacteria group bacterium]
MKSIIAYIKNHKLPTAVLILILAGGGYYWQKKSHSEAQTIKYVTQAAQKTTIISSITGTGQVAASNQVDIKAQTSGTIKSVPVKQGQSVKTGNVLATLDQQTASVQVAKAKASLEQAQAAYQELLDGPTTDDQALNNLSLKSAQKAVDQAKKNYDQTVIDQQQAVDKAHTTLLNADLQLTPSDTLTSTSVALSGSYLGQQEGQYIISLYQAGDGMHYQVNGLGGENRAIQKGLPQPIGNGLYITFGSTGTLSQTTTWTVDVPNQRSSNYASNLLAYNNALQSQTDALDKAQQSIDSANDSLLQTQIQIRQKTAAPTQASLDSAKAQIAAAQSDLADAQAAYNNTIITAPFDGVIATLDASMGDQANSGAAIATIITPQQIAEITLNEVDVAKVKIGQKATVTFDAIEGLTLTGKVAEIDAIGTVTQGVVNYNVKISLDTQDERVKPGMSVSASIITNMAADVLAVPNSAVKSGGSGSYVQVLGSDGKPQNITVQTGLSNDTETEIQNGLNEGQEVVTQTVSSGASTAASSQPSSGLRIPGMTGGGGFSGGNRTFIQGGK